jgi:hypothetical protein
LLRNFMLDPIDGGVLPFALPVGGVVSHPFLFFLFLPLALLAVAVSLACRTGVASAVDPDALKAAPS